LANQRKRGFRKKQRSIHKSRYRYKRRKKKQGEQARANRTTRTARTPKSAQKITPPPLLLPVILLPLPPRKKDDQAARTPRYCRGSPYLAGSKVPKNLGFGGIAPHLSFMVEVVVLEVGGVLEREEGRTPVVVASAAEAVVVVLLSSSGQRGQDSSHHGRRPQEESPASNSTCFSSPSHSSGASGIKSGLSPVLKVDIQSI
jgi:hypothetical protein